MELKKVGSDKECVLRQRVDHLGNGLIDHHFLYGIIYNSYGKEEFNKWS
jgi:hypothetical protein